MKISSIEQERNGPGENLHSMNRRMLILAFALMLGAALACGTARSFPAWAGPSPEASCQDGDIIIIDLVRRGSGKTAFLAAHYSSALACCDASSADIAVLDLSRGGHGPQARGAFSVVLFDADPSLFVMKRGCAVLNPLPRRHYRDYLPLIQEIAGRYQMDPQLILSVIEVESGFNPNACSSQNAMGLMQLIPETARSLNCRDPYDPYQNIQAGVRYLKMQLERFGSIELALAAYNAGPGAVENYGGIPPFRETQNYVRTILERYNSGIPDL